MQIVLSYIKKTKKKKKKNDNKRIQILKNKYYSLNIYFVVLKCGCGIVPISMLYPQIRELVTALFHGNPVLKDHSIRPIVKSK